MHLRKESGLEREGGVRSVFVVVFAWVCASKVQIKRRGIGYQFSGNKRPSKKIPKGNKEEEEP